MYSPQPSQQIQQPGNATHLFSGAVVRQFPSKSPPPFKKKPPLCRPLEKAYQHPEMPAALSPIWSRFILHIKCNLLNNESPLLLSTVLSLNFHPKKENKKAAYKVTHVYLLIQMKLRVKVQDVTRLRASQPEYRWNPGGVRGSRRCDVLLNMRSI